jgi:hypothetical protein
VRDSDIGIGEHPLSGYQLEGAVIDPIVQDDSGGAPDDVSVTVAELQRIADSSAPSDPPQRSIGRLRIMFVVGSSWPWRAIESDDASPDKRMMYFREPEQIRRIVLEHLASQRAAEEFIAEHMATPGNLPGITSDWVPSHSFDAVFESYRLRIRERIYRTASDRVGSIRSIRLPVRSPV